MKHRVIIEGFENEQQADEFINWFSNQGEQECIEHFEEHCDGKSPVFVTQTVDQPDAFTMRIKMVDT